MNFLNDWKNLDIAPLKNGKIGRIIIFIKFLSVLSFVIFLTIKLGCILLLIWLCEWNSLWTCIQIFQLHRISKIVKISNQKVRNSHSNLRMIKSFPMSLKLRKQSAELHSKHSFKVNCMVFWLWVLKFWH